MTNKLLGAAGLPVPRSEVVRTEDDAVAAAKRIGFPVVTKPLDGNHGRGVGLDITTDRTTRAGFKRALKESRNGRVVVESFVTGHDYRVLVIGGRMVAIAQRVPAHVIGDGKRTVRQLVELTNQDPRRGIGHEKVLTRIKIDDAAEELVKKQGFALDDVAAEGPDGEARRDGQHVDRRDLDRPDVGGPRGQRRDRRGGRARRGPGRGRHRLPGSRHRAARARDRRRDRRGERRTRLPHAHEPDRGRAAVRRQARGGPAVPAGDPGADPDRRRDGIEREDDDDADDRAHLPRDGPAGRRHLDRRHLHRRAIGEARRCVGAEVGVDGPAEPEGRHGDLRGGPRRDPARGPGLRAQRRRAWC